MPFDSFDVEAYAAKYSGRNRTDRLLFIAQTCPQLRGDAHQALLRELKSSLNMKLYLEVVEAATKDATESTANAGDAPETSASLDPSLVVDTAHVESVKRNVVQQHERLEQELNSYKSTMIKESIRVRYAILSLWRKWRVIHYVSVISNIYVRRLSIGCMLIDGVQ